VDGKECTACPVCVLLSSLSNAKPEVTLHLAAAARELALAVQALIDPGVNASAPAAETRFERIRID
jgi:hypothetical protein